MYIVPHTKLRGDVLKTCHYGHSTFRSVEKGKPGLSGMTCLVEYDGSTLRGIVEIVDQFRHKIVVYLIDRREVVELNSWDVVEVNKWIRKYVCAKS